MKTNCTHQMGGFTKKGFEKVAESFHENFAKDLEIGAAFCVYYKGEKVVDLWGGLQNRHTKQPWLENTMSMAWSTTKAIGAICIAILVDRGLLEYGKPVAKYWPEFAQFGKHGITVIQLISHQAGLVCIDGEKRVSLDFARHPKLIGETLAKQKPLWPPGSAHGYHAFTMGWYTDQIIRRVDPKRRSVGVFFKEEVAEPFGIDFRIGTPVEEEHRVAFQEDKKFKGLTYMLFHNPSQFLHLLCIELSRSSVYAKAKANMQEYCKIEASNTLAYHQMELPQCNGIGTARALAKLFSILTNGGFDRGTGKRLLSQAAAERFNLPVSIGKDLCYELDDLFTMFSCGLEVTCVEGRNIFGHPGYGGQYLYADPAKDLSWCSLANKLCMYGTPMQDPRYARLRNSMYECVSRLETNDPMLQFKEM